MATVPTGDKEQADSHRARGAELRAVADGMIDADSAKILRRLADQHDATADKLDGQAARSSKPGAK